jgi:hypothetical protein
MAADGTTSAGVAAAARAPSVSAEEASDSDEEEGASVTAKGKGKKGGGGGKRRAGGASAKKGAAAAAATKGKKKKGAAAVVEDAPPPPPLPPQPSLARTHARGYVDVLRLVDLYVSILLGKAVAQASEAGAAGAGGDDECDARLVLRRLIDDLLVLIDLPEWPIAEALLQRIVVLLVERLPPIPGAAAAPRPGAALQSVAAERATALLAVQLLGSMLPRLQLSRAFALENALRLPEAPVSTAANAAPTDSGEDAMCLCGRGAVTGMFMMDCDECHRWYHGVCVGVSHTNLPYWMCDDCGMRKQVAAFRVSAALPY